MSDENQMLNLGKILSVACNSSGKDIYVYESELIISWYASTNAQLGCGWETLKPLLVYSNVDGHNDIRPHVGWYTPYINMYTQLSALLLI